MNSMCCMKCGRETTLGQAFCKECLEDMSHYPVNPATPVQLPVQSTEVNNPRRPVRTRKGKKPEEQILRLRNQVRVQRFIIILLLIMLIGLGALAYQKLFSSVKPLRPGENYITTDVVQQTDLQ